MLVKKSYNRIFFISIHRIKSRAEPQSLWRLHWTKGCDVLLNYKCFRLCKFTIHAQTHSTSTENHFFRRFRYFYAIWQWNDDFFLTRTQLPPRGGEKHIKEYSKIQLQIGKPTVKSFVLAICFCKALTFIVNKKKKNRTERSVSFCFDARAAALIRQWVAYLRERRRVLWRALCFETTDRLDLCIRGELLKKKLKIKNKKKIEFFESPKARGNLRRVRNCGVIAQRRASRASLADLDRVRALI